MSITLLSLLQGTARLFFVLACLGSLKASCNSPISMKENQHESIGISHIKKRFEHYSTDFLDPPIIEIAKGKIAGKKVLIDSNRNLFPVIQYLGVPYAKPPLKDRRWKRPEKHGVWQGRCAILG